MLIVNHCLPMQLNRVWNSPYDKDCNVDIQISIRLDPVIQLPGAMLWSLISTDIETRKMKYISILKLSQSRFYQDCFTYQVTCN